jgi:hypothetical protein
VQTPSLDDLARLTLTLCGADMVTIQVVANGALRIAASRGFRRDFLTFFDVVHGDESACGAVLRGGATVFVDDVAASAVFQVPSARAVMAAAGSRAVVSMPVCARDGRLLGVVSPHRRAVGPLRPYQLRQLEWLAGQVAERLDPAGARVVAPPPAPDAAALLARADRVCADSRAVRQELAETLARMRAWGDATIRRG